MKRIFLTLAVLGMLLSGAALLLGLGLEDPRVRTPEAQGAVGRHLLAGLAGLCFATLVHAIALTYFMGTGRWLEETSRAYGLEPGRHAESRALKYRTIPAMCGCLVLLILTGGFGAAADPASPVGFAGWGPLSPAMLHFLCAVLALGTNLLVTVWEYVAIDRNGRLVEEVLGEVKRIRTERGLPT